MHLNGKRMIFLKGILNLNGYIWISPNLLSIISLTIIIMQTIAKIGPSIESTQIKGMSLTQIFLYEKAT